MASVQDIAPDWLSFIHADEWGVVWQRPPVAEGLGDPETYIHHSAGGRWGVNPVEAMRAFQEWYHDVKNYSTIAYDVVVHRDLSTDEIAICGAREGWLSAATVNRNDLGESICLLGYFHPGHTLSEHPTDRELEALAFAVAWSIENGWSAPNTSVRGHRDNPQQTNGTPCPGDNLYPHVPSIGARAFDLLALANQEPTNMITLPKPKRIYDSRDSGKPMKPGETRLINVGSGVSEVFVNLTYIGMSATNGFLSVSDEHHTTSVGNYAENDVKNSSFPALTPNGKLKLSNSHGSAHIIVDVMAQR